MRIFFVAQDTPNELALPQSTLWRANLHAALLDLGHEVIEFRHPWLPRGYALDPAIEADARKIAAHRPAFCDALVSAVTAAHREKPIDVFFSYFAAPHVEIDAIARIRAMGIVTLNWYCNGSYQFRLVEPIARAFDYSLVPEKFRLEDYRRAGARPIYCQEAANPNVYKPLDVERSYDVTFVGARYGTRGQFVRGLQRRGVDVRVWGPGWRLQRPLWRELFSAARRATRGQGWWLDRVSLDRSGEPLSDDALIAMYSRSKISLGFSAVAAIARRGEQQIRQVRLRDFEATMSGAFYMIEHVDELTEFFEPDREIVTFRSVDELVDKSRFYLRHDDARERIRIAGMNRARSEHTWQRRFQTVFQQIGIA